jgi:hypothetical protein
VQCKYNWILITKKKYKKDVEEKGQQINDTEIEIKNEIKRRRKGQQTGIKGKLLFRKWNLQMPCPKQRA